MAYRRQIVQALHYFARPHDRIPRQAIRTQAHWRADQLDESEWVIELDARARDELEAALRDVSADPRPTVELDARDFRLPEHGPMMRVIRGARERIEHGRGFVLIRGVPIERWSSAQIERFYWCFGLHLGLPGAQNPDGDLLGHVRDTGAPVDGSVRQYRTNERIAFHCDLADVVGLLCVRPAARGGHSRIASSVYAHDEVMRRRPDLVRFLYEPFRLDTKGEGGVPYIPVEPCRHYRGTLRTFWHSGYFRSVERYPWAESLRDEQRQLLDLYSEVLAEPGASLEMDLKPGDIQLLSNHSIVHGRDAFTDATDAGEGRHLLRLWISLPHRNAMGERISRERNRGRVLARLARLRLRGFLGRP